MPFHLRAVKTTPGAVEHVPNTAHRAGADSVGQRRVGVWSSHTVHRDDREALSLFVHDRSSQDFLVRGTHCFDSVVVPRATHLLLDDPDPVGKDEPHSEQYNRQRNSHALSL